MKNEMNVKLKKRLKADRYCNRLITIALGVLTICKGIGCITSFANGNVSGTSPNQLLGDWVRISLIFAIFLFLDIIMNEINKTGKPFTSKTVNCLRTMAVLTMLLVILPHVASLIGGFADPTATTLITIDFIKDGAFVMIGAALGIISEVFRYGCDLEDEMSSIA